MLLQNMRRVRAQRALSLLARVLCVALEAVGASLLVDVGACLA